MKKIISFLLILFLGFMLTSCDIVLEIVTGLLEDTFNEYEYPDYDYDNIKTASDLYNGFMPSTGDVHTLVLLVEFPDYHHDKYSHSKEYMEYVFFGESKNFESVASFYKKSSYGALNITGDVFGWYELPLKTETYESRYGSYTSDQILKDAIEYYVENDLINLHDYDSNNDGFVDAVSVIYFKPYDENSDIWWAYQTTYENGLGYDEYLEYDGMKISNYLFASVHFLGHSHRESDIDTLTFIHETGHLMGLDDYYDYDIFNNTQMGLGGADMMDENVGDHCSISKIILGWIDPIVVDVTKSGTYTINSFTKTGDVLLIPKSTYNGIFDEYYLVELYDPSGLNDTSNFLKKVGVRILHVDARLGYEGMSGMYFTYFNCDNSDTDNPFVDTVVEHKGIFETTVKDDDLFYKDEVFNKIKWYDGSSLDLELKIVNIDTDLVSATIEIIIE